MFNNVLKVIVSGIFQVTLFEVMYQETKRRVFIALC